MPAADHIFNTVPLVFNFLRHQGQYEMSTTSLTKALDEKSYLKEMEVANILKELSAAVSSYGEYIQSRLEYSYLNYSRHL